MKRIFVIRFAKKIEGPALYFAPYNGLLAFCPRLYDAHCWRTKKEAEFAIAEILKQVKDPKTHDLLKEDLSVEEHVFGDTKQ
jgi:hypothetical protein